MVLSMNVENDMDKACEEQGSFKENRKKLLLPIRKKQLKFWIHIDARRLREFNAHWIY